MSMCLLIMSSIHDRNGFGAVVQPCYQRGFCETKSYFSSTRFFKWIPRSMYYSNINIFFKTILLLIFFLNQSNITEIGTFKPRHRSELQRTKSWLQLAIHSDKHSKISLSTIIISKQEEADSLKIIILYLLSYLVLATDPFLKIHNIFRP